MIEIICVLSTKPHLLKKHVGEKYPSITDMKSQRKAVVMFYIYGILTATIGKQPKKKTCTCSTSKMTLIPLT